MEFRGSTIVHDNRNSHYKYKKWFAIFFTKLLHAAKRSGENRRVVYHQILLTSFNGGREEEMRCSTHPSDSGIGVCAFCLRERLSALTTSHAGFDEVSSPENHRDPDHSSAPPTPPPLLCHLSPFSNVGGKNRAAAGKFSLLSPLWGNPCPKQTESAAGLSKSSRSDNSWLLALSRTVRNKKTSSHVQPVNCRGMSPAAELSPRRGVSIPSPMCRKQSPRRFSNFALCLSPMVRPIPVNRRGHGPPEMAFLGEIQGMFSRRCGGDDGGAMVHEVSPCLRTNRSRKLVDVGKVW